ncbi:MAG: transglutaminase family protein [Planctomycetota bacterium]
MDFQKTIEPVKRAIRFNTVGSRSLIANAIGLAMLLVLTCFPGSIRAQETESSNDDTDSIGIRLGPVFESVWEFGLEIQSGGNASGIMATVPVPMSWPEQEVEIIDDFKSDNVSRVKRKSQTKWAEKMEFRVNRLQSGASATSYLRYRIKKKMIKAPADTSIFQFAKKVPSQVRTFLKPSPYIDSKDKRIIEIANNLKDDSLSAWDQVETNFRWVRDNVEYKFDKTIRTCLEALDNEHGDCEELSSLFIAICRAQGIPARAVWIPDHTYPEFYLVDQDGQGHWFPCQAAGNYEFGAMTEVKPILHKGDRFRIPGNKEEVRYLQPTLSASNATAPLGLKWIQREVAEPLTDSPK